MGLLNWDRVYDLSDLVIGKAPGRQSDEQVTLFNNNVGMGIQFAAVGAMVLRLAKESITHAEIGGSPGGRIEDLRMAARILNGRKVHPEVRFQVAPLTRGVFKQALREGLIEVLHDAGANIFPAGSGSNQATNTGALAPGQSMICTLARNFPGRHGSKEAKVYLASTYTVVASAIKGVITDPREFLE